ncbi:MAG: M1 family aminopeptidase [Bacteroidota bacterium]
MKKVALLIGVFFILCETSLIGQTSHVTCRHTKHSIASHFTGEKNQADISRSDTMDILNYDVTIDFTDWVGKSIKANCSVTFTPKINDIDYLNLDLLQLDVDSVVGTTGHLNFTHNDTLIHIDLPAALNINDTSNLTVYYKGIPPADPSGFGGIHWTSNYAFNLGVGFLADPHNFGRAWHPCFDNFVERATYDFKIIASGGRNAQCNGTYLGATAITGDTIRYDWRMDFPIPSYLACVAVGNYATVNQSHAGIGGNIPITLTGLPNDTTDLKNSFINLGASIDAFEFWYGEHQWEKVGYVLTSAGAMEHPTAIFYPDFIANGSLAFEDIMAHELGHHWWGNLITCETAEDMWINEGMAEYSSHLFFEAVYGFDNFIDRVIDNHLDVLQYAHIREDEYRAVSGIPHELTYGEHVYNKGAAVGHNLRTYLGDDLFRSGVQSLMNAFYLSDINSVEMRDHLTTATGVDMTPFFNDWVFSPGYSDFDIDSSEVSFNGSDYDITLHIKQKLRGAPAFHTNVPLTVTFYDQDWSTFKTDFMVSGPLLTVMVSAPFEPAISVLNHDNDLNLALSLDMLDIRVPGIHSAQRGKMQILAGLTPDSTLLKIEHHWTAPDPIQNNPLDYRISTSRYWVIDGIVADGFEGTGRIFYDGREVTGSGNGYLDNDLVSVTEDSIILLYRPDASEDWSVFPHFTKNTLGSSTNAYGLIILDSLWMGQYTLANGVLITDLEIPETTSDQILNVYPNPARNTVNVETNLGPNSGNQLLFFNVLGQPVTSPINISSNLQTVDMSRLSPGVYLLAIRDRNGVFVGIRKVEIIW